MKELIYKLIFLLRLPHLFQLVSSRLGYYPIVLFHDVNPIKNVLTGTLTPEEFERIIVFLKSKYVIQDLKGLPKVKENSNNAIFITFDDGMLSFKKYALPILQKHNIPVSLFIPTKGIMEQTTWNLKFFSLQPEERNLPMSKDNFKSIIEKLAQKELRLTENFKLMSWEQLREISTISNVSIQSHTHNHFYLSKLSAEDKEVEMKKSRDEIARELSLSPSMIAYPMGDYDNESLKLAEQYYEFGFATGDTLLNKGKLQKVKYKIPRIHISNGSVHELYLKTSGLYSLLKKIM